MVFGPVKGGDAAEYGVKGGILFKDIGDDIRLVIPMRISSVYTTR